MIKFRENLENLRNVILEWFGGGAPTPEASEMIKNLVDINEKLKTFENLHALFANFYLEKLNFNKS